VDHRCSSRWLVATRDSLELGRADFVARGLDLVSGAGMILASSGRRT
jgi:hypothetical protein